MQYQSGNILRIFASFRNIDEVLTDPTSVTFKVLEPGADSPTEYVYGTDLELIREGDGQYYLDIRAVTPGKWVYECSGDGTVTAKGESSFSIRQSNLNT